jgi:Na+/H+ antiporter NhaD/arsenite permease-like protein
MVSLLDSGRTLLDVPRSPDGGRARRFTRESEIRDHRARGESVVPQSARFVRAPKERQRMSTISSIAMRFATVAVVCILFAPPAAAAAAPVEPIHLLGVPVDFILFGLTLVGVALFHHHTLPIALAGLAAVTLYKLAFTGFKFGTGLAGLGLHLQHEWVILANLFLLLMGFALLSRHFEHSRIPDEMPALLPGDWKGGLVLLVMVCVLSSFLDNIAAALIGGTVARHVFSGKVHIGYLAAIVAASNAGGSGSVVGDTTTTMMWIDGVSPLSVLEAYVAAGAAMLIFGVPAAMQQQRFSPIVKRPPRDLHIEWTRVAIVAAILIAALAANVIANLKFPALLDALPIIGLAVWAVILIAAPVRRPDWEVMPETFKGTIFLLALVTTASMMPVEKLPAASWQTALGLGFVSAVFDNIPLTALALKQGGYDWGYLAYAVGFGGSMIWFGSSAGVALANMYPEGKSAGLWLRHGWHVALAYVIGFFVMLAVLGWHPDPDHRKQAAAGPGAIAATLAASDPLR